MEIDIPAVKLNPKLVFPMLNIIERNSNDSYKMREEIIELYRKNSSRLKPPSEKNIVRAVTFPSLRHLDLIEGTWPNIAINPNGTEILESYRTGGTAAAKRKFGTVIYRVDFRSSSIILTLKNLMKPDGTTSYNSLFSALTNKWNVERDKDKRVLWDRLKRWLLYLEFVDFITINKDSISVRESIIDNASKNKSLDLSSDKFTQVLLREYEHLQKGNGDSAYVSIPELRDAVCKAIPGMLKDEFYEYFNSTKLNTENYSIMLSEPMLRQEGGVRVGDKYYYYISIYKRR